MGSVPGTRAGGGGRWATSGGWTSSSWAAAPPTSRPGWPGRAPAPSPSTSPTPSCTTAARCQEHYGPVLPPRRSRRRARAAARRIVRSRGQRVRGQRVVRPGTLGRGGGPAAAPGRAAGVPHQQRPGHALRAGGRGVRDGAPAAAAARAQPRALARVAGPSSTPATASGSGSCPATASSSRPCTSCTPRRPPQRPPTTTSPRPSGPPGGRWRTSGPHDWTRAGRARSPGSWRLRLVPAAEALVRRLPCDLQRPGDTTRNRPSRMTRTLAVRSGSPQGDVAGGPAPRRTTRIELSPLPTRSEGRPRARRPRSALSGKAHEERGAPTARQLPALLAAVERTRANLARAGRRS